MPRKPPDVVSNTEAARLLGISRQVLLRWITSGRVPATKLDGRTGAWVLHRAEVDRIRAKRNKATLSRAS
jgi:excisionase family DNA binding protein